MLGLISKAFQLQHQSCLSSFSSSKGLQEKKSLVALHQRQELQI